MIECAACFAVSGPTASGLPLRRMPAATRPVFLDPLRVRLPVTATVSLAHRISGLLLVLATPTLVYALARSLSGPHGYDAMRALAGSAPARLASVLLVWCLAHHTAAGVRHILFDAGIGTRYAAARRSAWAVHAVALLATLLAAAGAFALDR